MHGVSYQDRFAGIARLYGVAALERFRSSKVAVIGIGGVGSWAAEALARTGFGEIHLIDMDDICVSNSNRQLHTLSSTVGQLKVEATADRLKGINPELIVNPIMDFLTPSNMTQYLGEMDYVLDAIDSVKVKAALAAWCKRNKVPLIMTGAAGGQTDPTQITVGDLNKTHNDPLAKKVRSILRREYNYSRNAKRNYSIPCVYSTEQLKYPQPDGSVCQQKSFEDGAVKLDCSGGFGAATMVTATFGFVAAAAVADRLAKKANEA
ncbi:MAG: tRNA cyclic N6-threonylcarbamoyladenosine(37) synthase TcdA [Gammaproteobacteria bacterium]|nr:tRNA cyclic N6-threonylcarbamoyladenosine(37) synthase TcdA [Gammaproteobacteria bacterium]